MKQAIKNTRFFLSSHLEEFSANIWQQRRMKGFWNDISAYSGESDSSVDEVSESDIDEGEDDELDPPALQELCMIYIYVYIVYIFIYTHNVIIINPYN